MSTQAATSSETDAEPHGPAQARPGDEAVRTAETLEEMDRVEKIRAIAYGFYEARGCVEGYALDDWIKAEATVMEATGDARQGPIAA